MVCSRLTKMNKPIVTLSELIILIVVASILIVTLLLPPAVGLSDNGDFIKMMSKFGLEHRVQTWGDRYFAYVDPIYVADQERAAWYQKAWVKTFVSSEIIFMAPAVWINDLFYSRRVFHLHFLGMVHIAIFLAGAFLLLTGARNANPLKRALGVFLSIIIFVDVGYISYFNSAYTETASLLFFMLLIAAAMPAIFRRQFTSVWIMLYFLFGLLFCFSRYTNALIYPLLALFGVIMAIHSRRAAGIAIAALAAIAGGLLIWISLRNAPLEYKQFSLYNHFFNALLPFSPNPAQDLKEFELDPSLQRYSKTTYFQPESAVNDAAANRAIEQKISTQTIMRFYLRHPRRILQAAFRSVPMGFSLRPGYGNYEKSAGKPPGAVSKGFAIWSSFRELLIPKSFWIAIVIFLLSAVNTFFPRRPLGETSFRILLILICVLQLVITSIASEPSDIIRHMFLFNLVFDLLLMIAVIDLLYACLFKSKIIEDASPS
jgi:hypothetical protein